MKIGKCSSVFTLFLASVLLTSCVGLVLSAPGDEATFTATELLGRITDSSVTVNVVAQETLEVYFQFGTEPGAYTGQTSPSVFPGNNPIEVVIGGLQSDTRYYYRMVYRKEGKIEWVYRDEHSFHTQRAPGSTFTFTIISDSHLGSMGSAPLYDQTLTNVLADNPDFHIDLGDTFMMDGVTSWSGTQSAYLSQRPHLGIISHSTPIFLAMGNHENEEGWNFDDTPFSQAIASINARKMYYPTPITDGFYTGNNDNSLTTIDGDHLREDYYAWEWGDMLFVVLDPFQYTMDLPYPPIAGEGSEPVTGDQWSWTLGKQQYDWFKNTLENSNAKFKFVFSHQVTGGQLTTGGMAGAPGYVRGGANAAPYFEWGGKNADGTWGFDTMRPGWGNVSIHQLMIDNGVNAYFHGHDHQYAYEKLDGIVYQEVPQPGTTGNGFNLYSESDPYTIKVLPSPGHLRVTVSPSEVTVDYVQSSLSGGTNGQVAYTYTIMPNSINETPVAYDQSVSTAKDTPVDITLYASDAEGDVLSYQIVTQPSHGTLSGTGNHGTYTPNPGYSGLDSFTFKTTDGWTESNIATVSITVTG